MILRKHIFILLLLLASCFGANAQRFFNLASSQVEVDSVLPEFTYAIPLYDNYDDSLYTVSILYPEFIDMTRTDIANYERLSNEPLPEMPVVKQQITVSRKKAMLETYFCPLVKRDGKYQILVSFMLKVEAKAKASTTKGNETLAKGYGAMANINDALTTGNNALAKNSSAAERYAANSILATGKWAKIRVPSSGVYQITESLIRKAGFSSLSKIKVYGYGGNLQAERLDGNTLKELDDLKEVATYDRGKSRLFYARGPVSWSSPTATRRTRNPYSDYGYYFITETTNSEEEPLKADSATFVSAFYPSNNDYHSIYEVDGYAWYHGGRNLYDSKAISNGSSQKVVLSKPANATSAQLSVNVSAGSWSSVEVLHNGASLGTITISVPAKYYSGNEAMKTYTISSQQDKDTITIKNNGSPPVRLDFVSAAWDKPSPAPSLDGSFPDAEYVYNITNQNHHADSAADMVIIIPTSQKLLKQANRLADFHRQHDGMRVNVVPADELFNEFSSGTPDANAYRRYMKMLYDRAETEADMPSHLLLFGDCVWDNRMLTQDCHNMSPDDYLLVFESENSFSETTCYADDGFYCLLDDGEGANLLTSDRPDIAVGRFPVTTEAEAKIMVDKTIGYVENKNAGSWQNTIVFMGDDGDANVHMHDVNEVADATISAHPEYLVRKIMWDAYPQETSASGHGYPVVTNLIKRLQSSGALIFDYGGHGRPDQVSHENVLRLTDFKAFSNKNLPLWVTATCDIMPYDGVEPTIGEAAVLNENGGAMAFFGTARTVFVPENKAINRAFMKYVLTYDSNGKPITIGEAQRLTKSYLITSSEDRSANKLQYQLLGDPAVALHLPTQKVVVDSINGISVNDTQKKATLQAGSIATISGHIEGNNDFTGLVSATVRDSRELITCNMNASADADSAFTFYDYTKYLFNGSDSIKNGKFHLSFAVPMDINYSDKAGIMNFHAVSSDKQMLAHGYCTNFIVGGTAAVDNDSIGPSIFCYLNSPSFVNGGNVNSTPYFVAQITDANGINSTGNGIGHDLQLIIDGDMAKTYTLNDNFVYDFGTYTSGTTYYQIPELSAGKHTLKFRAWDILNNSSTVSLDFNVVRGLTPKLFNVGVTKNPASTSTTFIINHDRVGTTMDVDIDVFDASGRLLWTRHESGVSTDGAYTSTWNLCTDSGQQLQTGVYLYRVRVACEGSSQASKANKLVVISNK